MKTSKYLTALIKSLFGVGLFYLLYLTSNIVIIKEYVEDPFIGGWVCGAWVVI
jgi:hypothetical protein